MATLNYTQDLVMVGPYSVAPGEPVWLGWYYTTSQMLSSFPSVQPADYNSGITIESTTVWVVGEAGPDGLPTSTNYGIWATNNAPADSGMAQVYVVALTTYY
jgi:hypothetical protein